MEECLKSCEVPFRVLEDCADIDAKSSAILDEASAHFKQHGTPFAVLIKRDTFDTYALNKKKETELIMSREQALDLVLRHINLNDIVVSTTGMPSREVFEIRAKAGAGHQRDFLTVGCMGHCSSIAAGIALSKPDRNVVCLDGDGAVMMHMGALAINGGLSATHRVDNAKPLLSNLKHVVINNGAHDSVGGQPTYGFDVSLTGVAKVCNYKIVRDEPCITVEETIAALKGMNEAEGPVFLEILVKKGNRKDLGRPTKSTLENKKDFVAFVQGENKL